MTSNIDIVNETFDRGPILDDNSILANVIIVDGPVIPPIARIEDGLDRKRQAVWNNDPRNAMIASIGSAFAARDIEPLWDLGVLLDLEQFPYPEPWPERTAVLVESAEHAQGLAKQLADWQLIHAESEVECLARKSIVTLVAAAQFDSFAPDVLVNAIGGDWVFDLPNFDAPTRHRRPVVVDIADDFDEIAERATQSRLREYHNRRWTISPEKYATPWPRTGS